MQQYFLIFCLLVSTSISNAEIKGKILQNLKDTKNLDFKFEQNVNGKIENGNCTIEYQKKIFCEYARSNNKILVSNGKSLVIKTRTSYYRYPLEKTALNLILDKNFLIDKNIIKKIVSLIDIKDKMILEVGPGTGNLTSALLEKYPKKRFVLEKDNNLPLIQI